MEVDLFWPEQKFVVEADSRRHHAIEVAFERDHKRTRELIAAGYGVLSAHRRVLGASRAVRLISLKTHQNPQGELHIVAPRP